ncbi:MAG: putative Ig domain-containing protein [Myxococcota bacterium]
MKKLSTLLFVALLSAPAWAQLPTVTTSTQPYTPLIGATALSFPSTDDSGVLVPLGFTFPYFGQNYTHVMISTNGVIMLGNASLTTCSTGCLGNTSFPSSGSPNTIIAGWWDDLSVSVGTVRYLASGGSFVVEYSGVQRLSTSATVTFQIRLDPSGAFTVHYGSITGAASDWTTSAGFESDTGTVGANFFSTCTTSCTLSDFIPNYLIRVGEPNDADLAVPSVTISNFVTAMDGNLTFDVQASLRNYGRTDAPNFFWKAFLSRDRVLDTTATDGGADIEVANGGPESLAAVDGGFTADGGLSIVNVSAMAATTTPPPTGEYYVLVQVDSTNAVMEASETNNVGSTASAFVQGTDLVATSVSGPATTGGGNVENFQISFFNRGTTAAGSVDFRILLSADQLFDQMDAPIFTGTRTVSGGQTITETISVPIPLNAPNGQFYYLLQVDPTNTITEANEMNNVAASAAKVDVRRADLVAEAVNFVDLVTGLDTTSARFGEAVRMRVRFRNAGGANANNFRVAMVLSTDSSLSLLSDSYVCDQTVVQVVPGTTSTEVTLDCALPLKNRSNVDFTTGQYYLFAAVDGTGAVFESNEANNNLMVGPIRITEPGPDLTVTSITAPASAGVGEVIPVVRTIRNVGNVDAPMVAYRYYASANDIITTDDVLLPIVTNAGNVNEGSVTLVRGASDTATELVLLPGTMPAGTYYVGCIVDPTATITKDLEPTNNALASRTMVVAASSLRVVNTALPDAVIGRPYSFRLSAVGEQGASTWRLDTGAPAWLSIGANDGLLSGTPTGSGGAEVVGLTVLLENASRQTAVRLALRVLPTTSGLDITTASLPAAVNSSTSQYQFALGAAGGVRPYQWRLAGGSLPTGMALSTDGVLFGAPRNASNGSLPLTFEVRDAVGGRVTKQIPLRLIASGSITFKTISIPDALIGQEYLQDIAVANQDGSMLAKPLVWQVTGAIPAGMAVTPQSELITVSGRPTEAGTFSFTIAVEDANGRTDALSFTMTVHPPRYRVVGTLPEVLRPGQTGVSVQLGVSPSASGVTYRVVSGTLPAGLSLDAAGLISGDVAQDAGEGLWSFIVEARDGAGMSGLSPLALRVEREPRNVGCSSSAGGPGFFALVAAALLGLGRRRSRKSALAVTAALSLAPLSALAQYQVVGPVPAAYTPLSSGAVTTPGAALSVPFSMPYFDTTFNSVSMSQYGYLAIGGSYASASGNLLIPHTSTSSLIPQMFIAPWWDALATPSSQANAYRYQISGTAPNRVMAFEWNSAWANVSANRVSFQVLLYETTGRIRFVYSTGLPGTVSASVGIQKERSVGAAALTCTASASCTSASYPAGQAIDFFLPPDLEVVTLSAPQVGYAGVAFPQTATVRNRGGRDASNVAVRFYLSTDATFDPMVDTVIGTTTVTNIEALGTAQATLNAPLPAMLSQSSYFVFASVDPDRAIVEQVENNNLSAPAPVTIGAPTADLIVSAFSAPTTAMPGGTIQVTRTLQNIGNAASVPAKYTYFVSDNSAVSIADRSLVVGNLAALNAGQNDMGMDSLTLPTELPPGNYWLGVCVNYDASTTSFGGSEITIVNNCFTQAAAVQVTTGSVAIATTSLPTATQFSPYGLRLQATGGTGAYTWELSSGALPSGLSLSSTGDLVGTPSASGTFSFDARVTSGTLSDTRSLSLQVMTGGIPLVIVDQALSAAQFGRSYTTSLVAVGGKPPYQWKVVDAAELPPGLGIASDGLLEGRPLMAGDFAFGVEVTDSLGAKVSKELALRVVTPTSLSIATSAVQAGAVGREYLQPLVAIGGTAPYTWTLIRFQELPETITDAPGPVLTPADGKFPADFGLTIDDRDTTDYLSGTPQRAGLFALTFKVKDGAETEDTASVLLRISYRDGLAITTLQLPDAFVNQVYQVRLSHNGGSDAVGIAFSEPCIQQAVRPGEFQCASSTPLERLPTGLSLSADGTILGTPNAEVGTYTFLVKVVDGQGRQDVRALALRLRPDFALEKSGCSSTGLSPSLVLVALTGLALRRRRR